MQKCERSAESGPDFGADDEIEQFIATGGARVIRANPAPAGVLQSPISASSDRIPHVGDGVSIRQKFNRQLQLP